MSKDQTEIIADSLKKSTIPEQSTRHTETTQIQKTLVPEKLPTKESNPTLKKWADLIANDIENPDQSPTIKISRFGLKTSKDVMTFLRSPAGDSVMAEIGTQLAAEKSLQDYEQLQLREKQLLMNRLKAAFFLWYIEKKAHAAEQRRDIILEQNERAIKNSGHTAQPTAPRSSSERTSLIKSIADYDRAIKAYQNRQSKLQSKRKDLDTKLVKLEAEAHMIDFKYNLYDLHLQDFDSTLERLENIPIRDNPKEDEQAISEIQEQINAIKAKMDQILLDVEELIKTNQDEDAALLMKSHTSLGLNCARHFDMLAVRRGDKHYVTEDGKTNLNGKPISFKDAYFILDKEEQIVKDGDKHYLLKPGQTWEAVSKDENALKAARDNFEQRKHELMVVENVVKHNKKLEAKFNKEQTTEVHDQIKKNEEKGSLLKNQIGLIQAAKASAQNLLDNPNLGLSAPRPTVTQGPSMLAPKQSFCPTGFYKNQLELEKFCKQPNVRDVLMDMAKQAPTNNRQMAMAFLNSEFSKIQPSTAPIPTLAMQRILQTLETWGVKAAKPSVTNIKQPLDLKKEAGKEVGEESPSPSRLTPLSTNPFKIN
jgi:effector protein LidA